MNSGPGDGAQSPSACLFEIAGRVFAIRITEAKEVRAFDEYTMVPLAPAQLIGMTNLRGAIVPIVDLRVMLDLPPRPSARALESLVVAARGARVALAIDRMLGIEPLVDGLAGDVRVETGGLACGSLARGDDTVPILDVVKIVDSLTTRTQEAM